MSNHNLHIRMKEYEYVTRNYLTKRTPVVIRIDGKAFHTFTRGFVKPFDEVLVNTMQQTMKYLCENIEGCVFGYTQSDEISLVLCDYKKLTSEAWFNANLQKICSVSSSMATLAFNRFFAENDAEWRKREFLRIDKIEDSAEKESQRELMSRYCKAHDKAAAMGALFDSRAFNIPKEEVNNYFLWRQNDATKNSIASTAQAHFSHKRLEGKNSSDMQELLWAEKGINWNNLDVHLKRGSCCMKCTATYETENGKPYTRSKWLINTNMPILSKDTDYINSLVIFN